jgi:hypothetical protein
VRRSTSTASTQIFRIEIVPRRGHDLERQASRRAIEAVAPISSNRWPPHWCTCADHCIRPPWCRSGTAHHKAGRRRSRCTRLRCRPMRTPRPHRRSQCRAHLEARLRSTVCRTRSSSRRRPSRSPTWPLLSPSPRRSARRLRSRPRRRSKTMGLSRSRPCRCTRGIQGSRDGQGGQQTDSCHPPFGIPGRPKA